MFGGGPPHLHPSWPWPPPRTGEVRAGSVAVLNLPHPDILLWSGGLAMSERRGDEGTSLGKTLGTLPVFVPEVLELREWRDIQDLRRRHRLQRFSGFRVTRSKVCYFTKI